MKQSKPLKTTGITTICYLHDRKDDTLVQLFKKHLGNLNKSGITWWSPDDIPAGSSKTAAIEYHLAHDQLILLFVSADFLSSDLYKLVESIAFKRYKVKTVQIIPILLRQISFDVYEELKQLRVLPGNENFIKGQRNRDEVFARIATELRLLIKDEQQLFLSNMPSTSSSIFWRVPYRNPFFTGREKELNNLATALQSEQSNIPQTLAGPGGVGKTQIAVEYAYRFRNTYQAVFWVQGNTREELITSFVSIAKTLNLPGKDNLNVDALITNVKQWLALHNRWLLIFDNVENGELIHEFIPPDIRGHLILTTPDQALGESVCPINVESMTPEEGTLLLFCSANMLAPQTDFEDIPIAEKRLALELFQELGGLPLALDQAGAYIQETQCGIAGYLREYRQRQARLLQRRGTQKKNHPQSVMATFLLSFRRVEKTNPVAADFLRLCAFLAPAAIPEELFTENIEQLAELSREDPSAQGTLNEIIVALRAYSLVQRDTGKNTLSVHHLVQVVLRDTMDRAISQWWAAQAVKAVNRVFPYGEYGTWLSRERHLAHALECAKVIKEYKLQLIEAAELLICTVRHLNDRGQYYKAEELAKQALVLQEQRFGSEHLAISHCLSLLVASYNGQGRYSEAERLLQRVLEIDKKILGSADIAIATDLNNLACLYAQQGFYGQAKALYQEVLNIYEQIPGLLDSNTGKSLNMLATLYLRQGKYEQAAPLYKWALDICMRDSNSFHPDVAENLEGLAEVYNKQGKYKQAEDLLKQALVVWEQTLGAKNPQTIATLSNLASVHSDQGNYERAARLHRQALEFYEETLGLLHPATMLSLNDLASVYTTQGKYQEAEELQCRALAVSEKVLRPNHPTVVTILNNLARLYIEQGKYEQAEQLWQQALTIREQTLGSSHPDTTAILSNLAVVFIARGFYEKAEELLQQVVKIWEDTLGPAHPNLAKGLINLASVYNRQEKFEQAESLLQRALAMQEQLLSPQHIDIATTLNNLAACYDEQGKYEQAWPLHEKVLIIREQILGPEHPNVANSLNNLAMSYADRKQYEKAEPLCQRALAIREQALGPQHPDTATSLYNLAKLYEKQGIDSEVALLYERALSIYVQTKGPTHPHTIEILQNYISYLLTNECKDEIMQLAVRFPMLLGKVEKRSLPYSLYIAEIRVDDDDELLPLFAYGKDEQQARDNIYPKFSIEDWNRVDIFSITPQPEGFQLSERIHLEGMIDEKFYQAYLPTIKKIRLPRIYSSENTLDIFANILQKFINAGIAVEVNVEIEEEEHNEEDEEGQEVAVEAGMVEIWFTIEKEIKVDETGLFLIADEHFTIEDVDSAWFDLSYSPWKTNTKVLCDLITELADAGHFIQSKVNDKDVKVLELEYRDRKIEVYYFLLDDDGIAVKKESGSSYITINDLFRTFYVRYDEMEAQSQLYTPYFDANKEDDKQ